MRTLVVVPTYNESESLPLLVESLNQLRERDVLDTDVLIVDDNSPDGTGELAQELSTSRPWFHVVERTAKLGYASAHQFGFEWALESDYDFLVQMDADGSHQATEIARLLARLGMPDNPGMVIASRRVAGSTEQWGPARRGLSVLANLYIRGLLGVQVRDYTSGFRAYRLSHDVYDQVKSHLTAAGYGYQAEMTQLWQTALWKSAGRGVVEIPTHFVPRIAGESKLTTGIATEELALVNRLAGARALNWARSVLQNWQRTSHPFR